MRPSADFETTILRALLAREGDFVSGAALARTSGVSRVAIWAHLHRLRTEGFAFEALPSRGYRLTQRPRRLAPLLVRALLPEKPASPTVLFYPSIDSTNEEAERQLATGRATPFVVLAGSQTAGRGRFGRVWHSPPDDNLYLTCGFRPNLAPERMHLFTLWMGLNLCDALAAFCGAAPGLKWPNDLYYGERKVGGMLTEARIDADHTRDLVFGLGLNVNAPATTWPRELTRTAVTLAEITGRPLDLNGLAATAIERILAAYEAFIAGRAQTPLADLWHRYDVLAGRRITVLQGDGRTTGTAQGIDNEGSLLLRTDHGRTVRFRAGEVSLQK